MKDQEYKIMQLEQELKAKQLPDEYMASVTETIKNLEKERDELNERLDFIAKSLLRKAKEHQSLIK